MINTLKLKSFKNAIWIFIIFSDLSLEVISSFIFFNLINLLLSSFFKKTLLSIIEAEDFSNLYLE
jgi:hypothetical protein